MSISGFGAKKLVSLRLFLSTQNICIGWEKKRQLSIRSLIWEHESSNSFLKYHEVCPVGNTVKPVLNDHFQKDQQLVFKINYRLMQVESIAECFQKYCRMLQWEHSATLSTFIKLPSVIKIFVVSILICRLTHVLPYFVTFVHLLYILLYYRFAGRKLYLREK